MPHIDPIPADADDPKLNPILDEFRTKGREVPMLYRTLGNAPAMLEAWVGMAWPLRSQPETDRGLRELMIMRVALLTNASFEWLAHWPAAIRAGIRQEQLEGLNNPTDAALFSEVEQTAIRVVDEVIGDGGASQDAIDALKGHFNESEIVELVLTATYYSCVSATLKSFGLEAEDPEAESQKVFERLTS